MSHSGGEAEPDGEENGSGARVWVKIYDAEKAVWPKQVIQTSVG